MTGVGLRAAGLGGEQRQGVGKSSNGSELRSSRTSPAVTTTGARHALDVGGHDEIAVARCGARAQQLEAGLGLRRVAPRARHLLTDDGEQAGVEAEHEVAIFADRLGELKALDEFAATRRAPSCRRPKPRI